MLIPRRWVSAGEGDFPSACVPIRRGRIQWPIDGVITKPMPERQP
jgi:hypothetical protein